MSVPRARSRRPHRLRRLAGATGVVVLAVVLLLWWLLPVYHMMLIALDPETIERRFEEFGRLTRFEPRPVADHA